MYGSHVAYIALHLVTCCVVHAYSDNIYNTTVAISIATVYRLYTVWYCNYTLIVPPTSCNLSVHITS